MCAYTYVYVSGGFCPKADLDMEYVPYPQPLIICDPYRPANPNIPSNPNNPEVPAASTSSGSNPNNPNNPNNPDQKDQCQQDIVSNGPSNPNNPEVTYKNKNVAGSCRIEGFQRPPPFILSSSLSLSLSLTHTFSVSL